MIPLVVRSHHSRMLGTSSVRALCAAARKLGYRKLALTDRDNLCGLIPFLAAAREEGITPIVGAEVTEVASSRRAVCLVEDEEGYRNLCRLLTRRHGEPAFSLDKDLAGHTGSLFILTDDAALLETLHSREASVGVCLPVKPAAANSELRRVAARLGVPAVAVPDAFFVAPEDWQLHRLFRAIAGNTTTSKLDAAAIAPADRFLAPAATYRERFAVWPEVTRATHVIAERSTFTGPRFGLVMPPWGGAGAAGRELKRLAYEGAARRYGDDLPEPVVERLERELATIDRMGFSSYFLVVREIVLASPRTCGRGSGAASLVAYVLGITNVCPVTHNLYFERFLNPGRKDPPDIDVDFAWDERDGILSMVLERFRGHAAMVSSHVLFQPRMAIREVAKVYGATDAEIGHITKRLPWLWQEDLAAGLETVLPTLPTLKDAQFPEPWPEILHWAGRMVGAPRHLSVHPGGVVITPRPVAEYVPVETAAKGVPIIQWDKDAAEETGLVKIDLLGNRSLGVVRDALAAARAGGADIDEWRWRPEEDPATRQTVARGRTMGCFYIESPAMRLLQEKAGTGDFNHLVIHSSIIRPAANDYIREYLRRLHGGAWDPIHPLLADVLAETYGIMVYQEDVSKAAVALAGFSHADADGLRKVLSKKDRARRLADYRERFAAGCAARGVSPAQQDAIWAMMMSFDGYSFCKPHSASYAQVSFQAAWLKTHFPAEFMAAVVSNQGGFYSAFAYVSEARRLGLAIRPPDVRTAGRAWAGRGRELTVGLMAVQGLGDGAIDRILRERERLAFSDTADFFCRVRPERDAARSLVHAGALDGLAPGPDRARLFWEFERVRGGQAGGGQLPFGAAVAAPEFPPEDRLTRLRREYRALGFLVDEHPMTLFRGRLDTKGAVPAAAVPARVGRRVRMGGWLIAGKTVRTKTDQAMKFLTVEDETGLVETTFFPEAYERFSHLLAYGRPYLLEGLVEQDFGVATLTVERLAPLGRMPEG